MTWNAITHDGEFVEVDDDVAHVVREMSRLWPELRVVCLNPAQMHELDAAPYMVIERCKDAVDRPVLSVWQLDNRLLELLHEADSHKNDILHVVEDNNRKVKQVRLDAERDWREAAKDVLAARAESRLGRWTFPDPRPDHEGELIVSDNDPMRRTVVR